MHNDDMQARYNLASRVCIPRRDLLVDLDVYLRVHMTAPTCRMSRRDRMCIQVYKNSRDRNRRT